MPLIKNKPRVPKPRSNIHLEHHYAASIILLLKPFHKLVESVLFPVLPKIIKSDSIRADDDADLIDNAIKEIRKRYSKIVNEKKIKNTSVDTAKRVNRQNKDYHDQTMQSILGINPIQTEPWLKPAVNKFVNENASLIKTIPTESLSDIEQMVYRDSSRALSTPELKEKIKEQFEVSEGRARVIARDQVAKFNSSLTEERQVNAGITTYTWKTSDDSRVRSDHSHLDGKVFNWKEPPVTVTTGKRAGERNHPGQDILCRCQAIPVLDDLI